MKSERIKEEIKELTLSEKLLLVEDIWDLIAADSSEVPVPVWQKEELDKRYEEYKAGELKLYNWEEIHNHLREKYK